MSDLLGPIIHTAIAVPLCSRGMRSAIVPPPRTKGAPPTAVHKLSFAGVDEVMCILTAHQEPEHYEHFHVRRDRSSDSKDDEQQIAAMVQWKPPIHFR